MKIHNLFLLVFLAIFASCSSDDDAVTTVPSGDYANGFFVLNEGGVGEVTFVSNDLNQVSQDIFSTANGSNQDLGVYLQSMFFDGDRAFIISNGSNKITVVNRYTFEHIATVDAGLVVPRYGVVVNGKAYVTNSNGFSSPTDDFIAVIDLNTYSVTSTIQPEEQTEKIVAYNGKLYVSGGFYGVGDKISVVDATSHQILTKITVDESPNSLEIVDQTMYVLSSSYVAESTLTKINLNTNSVISTHNIPASMSNAQNLVAENGKLYFTANAKIYSSNLDVTTITDAPLIDTQSESFYIGYGFAVQGNRIYITEATDDFSSDGKLFVYDLSGNLLTSIPTGLGPNGIYFN